ncbi:vasopressin V1a receptor-like [Paramacrobiotus metropolitanus]|uniref:vasopressin V1a receptor-like n=1 Tax=Paramacrobiotus metropolitanus TaxID=2943436 RepID=UPI0024459675|nr:vasopressin V1a receptor-like [Paramacrobiotus metropolitanus]XP_055332782.1 vasopressin V1a receptor-like [Paramacrobiotus metropolitanus]
MMPPEMSILCSNCSQTAAQLNTPVGILDPIHQSTEFFVLMVILMVMAIIGNSVILILLGRSSRCKRSVSIFILSLAVGDIFIAIVSMSTEILWEEIGQWTYGNAACKGLSYVQCLLFASTAFLLMSMSYDRYKAILYPLNWSRSIARSRRMVAISWILAFVVAVPHIFVFVLVDTGTLPDGSRRMACRSQGYTAAWQRKLYVTWLAIYVFVIPLCFMGFCGLKIALAVWKKSREHDQASGVLRRNTYMQTNILSHAKMRTIQLTLCMLASYLICWSPYFTVTLLNVWTDYRMKEHIPRAVSIAAQCGAWFSSCINPIIYGLFQLSMDSLRSMMCKQKPKQLDYDSQHNALLNGQLRAASAPASATHMHHDENLPLCTRTVALGSGYLHPPTATSHRPRARSVL